jgi:hypothetical protein
VDATARRRPPERKFIRCSVNVNVAGVSIDVAAPISPRFQPFQPQNPMYDRCINKTLPCKTDRSTTAKSRSYRLSGADPFRHPMQSSRSAICSLFFSRSYARSRNPDLLSQVVSIALWNPFQNPKSLLKNADRENVLCQAKTETVGSPDTICAQAETTQSTLLCNSAPAGLTTFFTSTFELRPLWSYFSRRSGGRSSGEPSAKPPFD